MFTIQTDSQSAPSAVWFHKAAQVSSLVCFRPDAGHSSLQVELASSFG